MTVTLQFCQHKVVTTCPMCGKEAIVGLTQEEQAKADKEKTFVQKAVLHKGHVVILYVDGQGRMRRTYAYDITNTTKDNHEIQEIDKELGVKTDLGKILEIMLKNSFGSLKSE